MKNIKYKIIFWGTPEFARIILEALIVSTYKPIMVITAPDKLTGRKQILTPSPIKNLAANHNIDIVQPQSLKDNIDLINKLSYIQPDLFIVAAYGLILSKKILNIPKHGSINVHPSLLPKYRGASPIHAAILKGDKITGVTIMLMDEKIDHGPIISDLRFKIDDLRITYPELSDELAKFGGKLLIKILPKYLKGKIIPRPQDHKKAIFTKKIKKIDGKIDLNKSAQKIEKMVRAYSVWPNVSAIISSVSSNINNKLLKIIESEALELEHNKKPGTFFLTDDNQLAVACRKNILILKKVQLEGKRPIYGKDLLNGYPNIINSTLK